MVKRTFPHLFSKCNMRVTFGRHIPVATCVLFGNAHAQICHSVLI